jgi:hypothetical protein
MASSPGSTPAAPLVKVRADMGTERRIFSFTQSFRIGRTDECEVCIKNEHVSRRHVEVVFQNGSWLIRDLQSANGIFVNGEQVQSVPLLTALQIRLGIRGPVVEFIVEAQVSNQVKDWSHYVGPADDPSIGDHTRMIRLGVAQVQNEIETKEKRKYGGIIAALLLCALAAGGYAFYLHHETQKNRTIAQEMFYSMKSIDLNIANVELLLGASGNAQASEEVERLRSQRQNLDNSYNRLLASLKIYDPKMSEQQKIVLRVARIFGECEVAMPPDFLTEVQNYINKWKSSGRYQRAVNLAKEKGYTPTIAHEFLAQGLPPQFFYLGMQESDFDDLVSGPPTHAGIAKGMWQFIPSTAETYGLKLGPLVDMRRPDPGDDRHHWDRETKAAAAYIKFLYSTDAQASGLLVMACYNWGEKSVLPLVQTMPKNPRERNFWKLLSLYRKKIPDQTYDYVFYIVSAAVIGENPRLFGFDFDNPLAGY